MTKGTSNSTQLMLCRRLCQAFAPSHQEVVIPGYSALAEYLARFAGIDISFFVLLCAPGLLLWTGIRLTDPRVDTTL